MANLPTFEQTVDTIHKWIDTSTNEIHLNMIRDVVERFVVERFHNHVSPLELAIAQNLLDNHIEEKKTSIIGYGLEVIS